MLYLNSESELVATVKPVALGGLLIRLNTADVRTAFADEQDIRTVSALCALPTYSLRNLRTLCVHCP